jgi:ABC-type multidrug transport system ATPase subunit
MKQRLGLARALVNSPRVLFLDEPTLGLDPQGQEDVQQLLKRLNEGGVTVFYSSHLLHEVAHLCSVIAVINRGRLAAEGTIAELQRKTGSEDLRDIFMALTSD